MTAMVPHTETEPSPLSPLRPCFTKSNNKSHSLFDSLPLEVLQEVFLQCLPPPLPSDVLPELLYHSLDIQGGTPNVAPLLLCQICKHWRTAALSLPRLWMSLDVFVSMGKARPSPPLVSLWLSRSRSVPLYLSIHQQNESTGNRVAAGEVLEVFKGHIEHWGGMHLCLAAPSSYSKVLTPNQRAAPQLREFTMQIQSRGHHAPELDQSIFTTATAASTVSPTASSFGSSTPSSSSFPFSFWDTAEEMWGDNIWGIFAHVPRLTKLQLSKIPDLSITAETLLPVPWEQLTFLSLDYVPSIVTVVCLLGKCPNLVEVEVKVDSLLGSLPAGFLVEVEGEGEEGGRGDDEDDALQDALDALVPASPSPPPSTTDPPIAPHTSLTSLTLNIDHANLPSLLHTLTLPSLTSLSLHIRGTLDQYPWPQRAFTSFLSRSKCPLTRLELYDTGMKCGEFADCLRNGVLQGVREVVVQDRRDWTWDPFVTDFAMELMTHGGFGGGMSLGSAVGPVGTGASGGGGGLGAVHQCVDANEGFPLEEIVLANAPADSGTEPGLREEETSGNGNGNSSGGNEGSSSSIIAGGRGDPSGNNHGRDAESTNGATLLGLNQLPHSHHLEDHPRHRLQSELELEGHPQNPNDARHPTKLTSPSVAAPPTLACAFPLLESLTLRGSCIWTKDGSIADMVESRWRFHQHAQPEISRLKRLAIEITAGNVEDMRRLKEFASEGLELDLVYR